RLHLFFLSCSLYTDTPPPHSYPLSLHDALPIYFAPSPAIPACTVSLIALNKPSIINTPHLRYMLMTDYYVLNDIVIFELSIVCYLYYRTINNLIGFLFILR